MKHGDFAARLAYLRWLYSRGRLYAENDKAFARRAGVGYEWFRKWMVRPDAPNERIRTDKLAAALGWDADWLVSAKGDAKEPDVWESWLADYEQKRSAPSANDDVLNPGDADKMNPRQRDRIRREAATERSEQATRARGARPRRGRR